MAVTALGRSLRSRRIAIGFTEPRHGSRSPGFGTYGKTEEDWDPEPLKLQCPNRPGILKVGPLFQLPFR